MKIIQLILRILISPLIFGLSALVMLVFPGTIMLFVGGIQLIYKLLGGSVEDDYLHIFQMTTAIFWFPFMNTYFWIKDAKFIE